MNSHSFKKCRILKETKHERGNENNCQTHEDFKYRNYKGALKKNLLSMFKDINKEDKIYMKSTDSNQL